jgi:hypothetical protein
MSESRETIINGLIAELPALLFTGDPVVNILAPDALEKLARLRKLLRAGQTAAASELVERELAPALQKLVEMLGELVERNVAPYRGMPAVPRVIELCREFQEVHRPEFQRSAINR